MIVQELIAILGLDIDEQSFNAGTAAIGKIVDNVGKVAIGAVAAGLGVVTAFNKSTAEVVALSEALGVSSELLENMGAMVKPLGMDFNNVGDLVEELNNKIGESKGMGDVMTPVKESLQILGLEYKKLAAMSPEDQFKTVTKAAMELEDAQAAVAATDILMGAEATKIIGLMRSKGQSFDKLMEAQNRLNFNTDRSRAGAVAWTAAWQSLVQVGASLLKFISGLIGEALAPYVTATVDAIASTKEWLHTNADTVIYALGVAFKVAAVAIGAFLALKVYGAFMAIRSAILVAQTVMAGFSATALLIPLAIAAVVAAVAWLAHDIYTYFSSGGKADSALGSLIERFPQVGVAIEALAAKLSEMGALLGDLWDSVVKGFEPLLELLGASDFTASFSGLATFLGEVLVSALQILISLFTAWVSVTIEGINVVMSALSGIGEVLGTVIAQVVLFGQQVAATFTNMVTAVMEVLTPIGAMIATAFSTVVEVVMEVLTPIGAMIAMVFTTMVATVTTALSTLGTMIAMVFTNLAAVVMEALAPIGMMITTVFTSIATTVTTVLSTLGAMVVSVFTSMVTTIVSLFASLGAQISSVLTSAIGSAVAIARSLIASLAPVFAMVRAVIATVRAAVMQLAGAMGAIASAARSAVSGAIAAFSSLVSAARGAWGAVKGVFSSMSGAVAGIGAKISGAVSSARASIGSLNTSVVHSSTRSIAPTKAGSTNTTNSVSKSRSIVNQNTTTVVIKGGDTKAVAATVRREMNRANSVSVKQTSSGQEY